MADEVDWGAVEQQLKNKSGQWYDPTMLADVQRNSSYGAGGGANNVDDWVNRVANKSQLRASNEANSTYVANGQGGVTVGPTGKVNDPNGTGMSQNTAQQWNSAQAPAVDPALARQRDDLYNMLMSRATQGTNVDRNNPAIRMQADAYSANAERAKRNYLSDTAEGAGQYANMTGERRMANERVGQQTGAFEADLVGRELTAKREEIAQALESMQGMLTESQRMELQKQLAMMNQAIQNRSLSIQEKGQGQNYDIGLRSSGLAGSRLDWEMNPNNPANWPS